MALRDKDGKFINSGQYIEKECQQCHQSFWSYQSLNKKYCSLQCRYNSQKGKVEKRLDRTGKTPWNKGIEYYAIKENKHPNWKGGITSKYDKIRRTLKYQGWRKQVLERDNYTCQICGEEGKSLHAHHPIKVRELIDNNLIKYIFDIRNGITLCLKCHRF